MDVVVAKNILNARWLDAITFLVPGLQRPDRMVDLCPGVRIVWCRVLTDMIRSGSGAPVLATFRRLAIGVAWNSRVGRALARGALSACGGNGNGESEKVGV